MDPEDALDRVEADFRAHAEALGRPGDVAIGFSTSGRSENVVRGLRRARELGLCTVAFTGPGGGLLADLADVLVAAPAEETPRIQELHILAAHSLCALVEDALFPPA